MSRISVDVHGITHIQVDEDFGWAMLTEMGEIVQRIDLYSPTGLSQDARRQWWLRFAVAILAAVDQPGHHIIDLPMGEEIAYTVGMLEGHIMHRPAEQA